MDPLMTCPACGSGEVKRDGQAKGKQRYQCRKCGHKTVTLAPQKISPLIGKILDRYTDNELRALAEGGSLHRDKNPTAPKITFDGDEFCALFVTDTHIGEESFQDYLWEAALEEAASEGAHMIFHAGDIHEGMSNRPDQVYHLDDIGFSAQLDHAERLFRMSPIPIKCISGNHDRWGIKSSGLFAVRDLARRLPGKVEYLGEDCGDIIINGTRWRLWHGEDGSSYATSYRVQKIIESFTGGDKPSVLLCGHTHKQIHMFERNIEAVSGGALSYQSSWMKSTRKACHTGFHILRCRIRDGEVKRFSATWYPFYE
jgi:predicted phosphodiesterase